MRKRFSLIVLVSLGCLFMSAPAFAHPALVIAQGTDSDSDTSGEDEGGQGQSDPEAETGTEEDASQDAATETGPPWTFQMARISIVLLVLIALAIGRLYYKLVASRQRGAA